MSKLFKLYSIHWQFAYCLLCGLLCHFPEGYSQNQLTTPIEILNFMEASPTVYEFEQLYGKAPTLERPVLKHGYYLDTLDGKEYQRYYMEEATEEEQVWLQEAKDLLNIERPKYEKVRKLYQKVLKKSPNNASICTLIGETFYLEKEFAKAKKWLDKALSINPVDYLAHWYLAEVFLAQQQIDTALTSLTLAHLYNRNHPRLLKRLCQVYQQHNQIYYNNWGFSPQMHVYKDGTTVVVAADGIWLTYGLYKAVWNHDPDYQYIKSQQATSDYLFQQEFEAILGTYMTYTELKESDPRNYPVMNALGIALDKELVEAFVMYELLLVQRPTLAAHLTPTFQQHILTYIQRVRSIDYVIDED